MRFTEIWRKQKLFTLSLAAFMLAGGIVLGIPGVILAVPVALVVKSTLATVYGDTPK